MFRAVLLMNFMSLILKNIFLLFSVAVQWSRNLCSIVFGSIFQHSKYSVKT